MTRRLDYDRIGARYDDEPVRQRPADPELVAFVDARGRDDLDVLDVACGTGIQLVANRERFGAMRLVGLDLHRAMLDAARHKRSDIEWVQGDATALPFDDASFDFVSHQFAFHHVRDKPALLREVRRVLRPGGRFAMVNIAPHRMPSWDVYRFFPEAFELDQRDFLEVTRVLEALDAAGFVGTREARAEDLRAEVDLEERLAFYRERYSPSQILAIDDDAYHAGLARIERALAGGLTTVETHVHLVTLLGDHPSRESPDRNDRA